LLLDNPLSDPDKQFSDRWWNAAETEHVPVPAGAPVVKDVEKKSNSTSHMKQNRQKILPLNCDRQCEHTGNKFQCKQNKRY
jgi:hypothetical protein